MNHNSAPDINAISLSQVKSQRTLIRFISALSNDFDTIQNKPYPKINTIEHAYRPVIYPNKKFLDLNQISRANLNQNAQAMHLVKLHNIGLDKNSVNSYFMLNGMHKSDYVYKPLKNLNNFDSKINSWKIRFKKFFQLHQKLNSLIRENHIIEFVGKRFLEVDNHGSTFWQGILFHVNIKECSGESKFYLELFKKFCDKFEFMLEFDLITREDLKKLFNHDFETQDDILMSLIKNQIAHRADYSNNSLLKQLINLGANPTNAINYTSKEILYLDKALTNFDKRKPNSNFNSKRNNAVKNESIKKISRQIRFLEHIYLCLQNEPFIRQSSKKQYMYFNHNQYILSVMADFKNDEYKQIKPNSDRAIVVKKIENSLENNSKDSDLTQKNFSLKKNHLINSPSASTFTNSLAKKTAASNEVELVSPIKSNYKNIPLQKIKKIVNYLGIKVKDFIISEARLEKDLTSLSLSLSPLSELHHILSRYKLTKFTTALDRSLSHFSDMSQKPLGPDTLCQLDEVFKNAKEAVQNGEIKLIKDMIRVKDLVQFSQEKIINILGETANNEKRIVKKAQLSDSEASDIAKPFSVVSSKTSLAALINNQTKKDVFWPETTSSVAAALPANIDGEIKQESKTNHLNLLKNLEKDHSIKERKRKSEFAVRINTTNQIPGKKKIKK